MGLKCLIILEQRLKDPPHAYMNSGNVFLDKLFGAEVILCPKDQNILDYSEKVTKDLKSKGTNVYFIPGGGSNSIGALGYVKCFDEILKENSKYNFTHIVHATGSSGTQAGLLAGKKFFKSQIPVVGICIRYEKKVQEEKVYNEAKKVCEKLQCNILDKSEVILYDEYIGPGYGEPTEEMIEAINLLAKKEAILLDPVYSGKGFAGLIGLIRKNKLTKNDNVLFIHTGGAVSLSAYEWAFKL
jgi:L-cysteate sulfo-lyase